eukprot:COSAG01_NODE_10045_length_2264_cov_1.233718_2_plen_615_part_01
MSKLKQFAEDKSWEQTQLAQQQTTLATFNGMSNVHLRQQLHRRGLGFRGSRALLLARLQRALEDNLNRKRVARKASQRRDQHRAALEALKTRPPTQENADTQYEDVANTLLASKYPGKDSANAVVHSHANISRDSAYAHTQTPELHQERVGPKTEVNPTADTEHSLGDKLDQNATRENAAVAKLADDGATSQHTTETKSRGATPTVKDNETGRLSPFNGGRLALDRPRQLATDLAINTTKTHVVQLSDNKVSKGQNVPNSSNVDGSSSTPHAAQDKHDINTAMEYEVLGKPNVARTKNDTTANIEHAASDISLADTAFVQTGAQLDNENRFAQLMQPGSASSMCTVAPELDAKYNTASATDISDSPPAMEAVELSRVLEMDHVGYDHPRGGASHRGVPGGASFAGQPPIQDLVNQSLENESLPTEGDVTTSQAKESGHPIMNEGVADLQQAGNERSSRVLPSRHSLTIDFGEGKVEKLVFSANDSAAALASQFVKDHDLENDPHAYNDVKANIERTLKTVVLTPTKPTTTPDESEGAEEQVSDSLHSLFERYDTSGDGLLTRLELPSLLQELGIEVTETEVDDLVAEILPQSQSTPSSVGHVGVSLSHLRQLLN